MAFTGGRGLCRRTLPEAGGQILQLYQHAAALPVSLLTGYRIASNGVLNKATITHVTYNMH